MSLVTFRAPEGQAPAFGLVHVTLAGEIIDCDNTYAGFLGVSRQDAIGRLVSDFTAGAGSGGPVTMISILVRTGEPMSVRRTFVRQDGSKLACSFSLCLIRDARGAPHSVVGVGQVIPGADA
jgi:PAS domain S-box-containing protein